jgi:hypothetical protein
MTDVTRTSLMHAIMHAILFDVVENVVIEDYTIKYIDGYYYFDGYFYATLPTKKQSKSKPVVGHKPPYITQINKFCKSIYVSG